MIDGKASGGVSRSWTLQIPSAERINALLLVAIWLWHWILKVLSSNKLDISGVIQTRRPDELKAPLTNSQLNKASRSFAVKVTRIIGPLLLVSILCQSIQEKTNSLIHGILTVAPLAKFFVIIGFILWECAIVRYCTKRLLFIETSPRSLRNVYILLSDTLTSFGKPLVDLSLYASTIFLSEGSLWTHFDLMISLIPLQVRVFQCLREFFLTRHKSSLFNVLKYCSNIPIIIYVWYSRIQPDDYDYHKHGWFLLFNSCYTFFWDIRMDWGLNSIIKIRSGKITFPRIIYYLGGLFNLVIKFWWIWTINGQRHDVFFANELQYLEIFRRAVWIVFKLESEYVAKEKTTTEK